MKSNPITTPVRCGVPTDAQLMSIKVAHQGEYELTDKGMRSVRSRIYTMNRDTNRKYRTMREGSLLYVWRIK